MGILCFIQNPPIFVILFLLVISLSNAILITFHFPFLLLSSLPSGDLETLLPPRLGLRVTLRFGDLEVLRAPPLGLKVSISYLMSSISFSETLGTMILSLTSINSTCASFFGSVEPKSRRFASLTASLLSLSMIEYLSISVSGMLRMLKAFLCCSRIHLDPLIIVE